MINLHNSLYIEQWRNNQRIDTRKTHNEINYFGRARLLQKVFFPSMFIGSLNWYIGLIDNLTYISTSETDLLGQPLQWTELQSFAVENDINPSGRLPWTPDATASVGSIENTILNNLTLTEDGDIKGIFITNNSEFGVIGGGILWATAILVSGITARANDVLKIGYRVSLTNDPDYVSDEGFP